MKKKFKKYFRPIYDILSHVKYLFLFKKSQERLKELNDFVTNEKKYNNKTIVFNMVRTYIRIQIFIELIFALKLKARGYNIVVLYDDGVLNHHETLTKSDKPSYSRYYWIREKLTSRLLQSVPFIKKILYPYSRLKVIVNDDEVDEVINNNFIYDKIDLFEYIEASLVRFFLSAPDERILKKEQDYEKALKFFTKNALLSYKIAESSIKVFNPDMMITSHGIYTTWGVFMKNYLKNNIKVITYGSNGYIANALDFGINDVAANKIDNGFFKHWVENMSEEEKVNYIKIANEKMEERFGGKSADTSRIMSYVGDSNNLNLQKVYKLKQQGKKIFALFPNVMWDNATTFKEWNTVFSSPVEWLIETVKYFKNSDEKILVIRVHPAEYLWMDVRVGIKDILEEYFGKDIFNHKNIIFIPPYEKVLSYELFDLLDGGIVYNGTIGLELMYKQIPLIMGARTAYSNKGFTKEIYSKKEYFDSFDNLEDFLNIQEINRELLLLFIYEYFFIHGVPLKLLSSKNLLEPNFEDNIKDIWNDKNLEFVLDVIEGKRKYFQEWKNK